MAEVWVRAMNVSIFVFFDPFPHRLSEVSLLEAVPDFITRARNPKKELIVT
jgi:hypothetical protein